MLKFSGLIIWRLGSRNYLRKYSASGATILKNNTESSGNVTDKNVEESPFPAKEGLVAAAFASLNDPVNENRKPSLKSFKQSRGQQIDSQIIKAEDLNSLLLVAENPIVSRRHALKMVSILSEWSSSNKVNLTDFEKDPRFLKLCRILARTPATQAMSSLTMAEDLSTVLGITGDDEAARLIANLSLPQMIKVMKALQQKGRRSTPLLRALSYNITKQAEPLDLKKSADLLFSMAALNFPDPLLSDRICSDVIEALSGGGGGGKPAVTNSIFVSLGLLRLRHEAALAALAAALLAPPTDTPPAPAPAPPPAYLASAVVTLAAVHYVPPPAIPVIEAALLLKKEEMVKASAWLDLVYALLILGKAEQHHLVSTLKPDFIEMLLSSGEIPIPSRLKLMSIDAYVGLTFPSNKTRLPEDISVGVPVMHTKEKTLYVQSIMDTFKSLVSADTFLKRGCDSGMGFLYDAEFAVDSKCHPVPLSQAENRNDVHRVAVLSLDYRDMTRGPAVPTPLGPRTLHARLLTLQGFKVLQIPYTEYNPKDKLVTRVQYIEKRLKEIINESNS